MSWLEIECVVHAACCSGQKALNCSFNLKSSLEIIKWPFIDPLGFSFGLEKKLQNQNFVSLKSFFAKLDMKWAESTYWDCSSIFWRSNYILPQWVETFSEEKLFSGPVKPRLLRRHNSPPQIVVCTLQKQNLFFNRPSISSCSSIFLKLLLALHCF